MPDEKPGVHVVRTADFSSPRPFKTTRGAFHSYTYLPLLGWVPPAEWMVLLAVFGVALALALPQPTLFRKVLLFVGVAAALPLLFGALALMLRLIAAIRTKH